MGNISRSPGIRKAFEDVFPVPIIATAAPASTNIKHPLGQLWVRTDTAQVYILAALSSGSATWSLASPGASDVDTLTGDSGGAIPPTGGTITLAGGTNITSVGAVNTVTFNLDAAITLATSVTSALYTTAAATDLLITAVSGQDVIIKLGDAAGANKLSVTDTSDVEQFAVDSNGGLTMGAVTFTGLVTAQASMTVSTAGTALNLGSDNNSAAVNLGVGTTARAIGIGNSAAAHTITIGSVTGAASLDLLCGTGDFTLEGDVASVYDFSATGVNTGTFTIAAGTGARIVNLATGGTGVKTVNIATSAIGNIVTIGTVTAAASLDLLCGTGNFTLEGATGSTYDISSTGVNTGTCTFGAGTGARIVNLATGGTGAKTVNIATAAIGNIVTIGTVTAAASLDLLCGTGNFTLEGATASTYDISATGVNTGTCTFGAGTGARIVNLATGGTGVKTVNVATGAIGNIVTIGTVTAAASLDLLCGTGDFTLEGDVASTYDISSTGVNTGTCTFASGTGARTVELAGGGTGIKTINIGAAATADVITIGTTTGAGSLTLAAGTGDITVSGSFKEVNSEFAFSTGTDLTVTQSPVMTTAADTGGVATGSGGDVNLMSLQDGCLMEQFLIGTQTIIAPRMVASNGLIISLDLTDNEGAEYNFGSRANAKHAYTIGTSAAFFVEAELFAADLSGLEPLWLGFRVVEANNATWDSYTDFYGIGMNNATSATNIALTGRLNSGGVTLQTSGTAWTGGDGGTVTLRVLVSAAGVITATIDGGAPSSPLAQTFDNADVVMPCLHFLHDTTTPGAIGLKALKIGFQA